MSELRTLGEVQAELERADRERNALLAMELDGDQGQHGLRLEETVIGACLVDGLASFEEAREAGIAPRCFAYRRHRIIFASMGLLADNGRPIDGLTVIEELRESGRLESAGGRRIVERLESVEPPPQGISYHARLLSEHSRRRGALEAAKAVEQELVDGENVSAVIDRAQTRFLELDGAADGSTVANLLELAEELRDELPVLGKSPRRTPLGLVTVDRHFGGGATPGELMILAGRPGMGKTALALSWIHQMAVRQRRPVAFFSLEMSARQCLQRLVALDSGIDLGRRGSSNAQDRVIDSLARVADAPIYIDETSAIPIFELRSRARRFVRDRGAEAVMIDYLQLMRGETDREKRHETIGEISRGLKGAARDLDIPVVALAQVSRQAEQRGQKRPTLADLRESGDIEQDADSVLFVFREGYYRREEAEEADGYEVAELIVAKNRNGPVGTIKLAYLANLPGFGDLTMREVA